MTSEPFTFFGFRVTAETEYSSDAIGVSVNGVRMLNNQYETGRRLARAGSEGVPARDVLRTDIQILESAYHKIETDDLGRRYYLRGELRKPDRYLVKVKDQPVERTGQYGGSTIEKRWF